MYNIYCDNIDTLGYKRRQNAYIVLLPDLFYGKTKHRKILEHMISWKVLKIFAKNVLMMSLS